MSVVFVMRSVLLALLASLLTLALLPTTAAQDATHPTYHLKAEVSFDDALVVPVHDLREVDIIVTVECTSVGVERSLDPREVHFMVRPHHTWAVATLSKSQEHFSFDPQECVDGATQVFPLTATIAFTEDAPAFSRTQFEFIAQMPSGERISVEFTLRPAFVERWEVAIESPLHQVPAHIIHEIPVRIVNHGNGAIFVRFHISDDTSPGVNLAPPAPIVVPSLIAGGETNEATALVAMQTPSSPGQRVTVAVDLTGNSADDPSIALESSHITTLVETTDAGEVPAVGELPNGPVLFVPLMALLAWVAARRRQ